MYVRILVPFAEIPQADLVEVMESQSACDRVRQDKLARRQGLDNDIGQVQLEEVDVALDRAAGQVAHFDLLTDVSRFH